MKTRPLRLARTLLAVLALAIPSACSDEAGQNTDVAADTVGDAPNGDAAADAADLDVQDGDPSVEPDAPDAENDDAEDVRDDSTDAGDAGDAGDAQDDTQDDVVDDASDTSDAPEVSDDGGAGDLDGDALDSADSDGDAGVILPSEPVYADDCWPRTDAVASSERLDLVSLLPTNGLIDDPVQFVFVPDGSGRAVVVDQRGYLLITDEILLPPAGSGASTVALWLDWHNEVVFGSESGLLSIAFHPDFESNRFVYLSYNAPSTPEHTSTIVRMTLGDDGRPDSDTLYPIFELNQPYWNHNGGLIAFGPDGYLYFGLGDGGSGGDPQNRAQNRLSLLGKMLRLDVDNPGEVENYSIPADNPFVGDATTLDEIYALGLRNPWRFSFDSRDETLWLGDVGQVSFEEVDIITAGGNYGWRIMEGNACYSPSVGCNTSGLIRPVHDYGRSQGFAVTGGYVYRGTRDPELQGSYVYGDYGTGRIWALTSNGAGGYVNRLLRDTSLLISSFGQDEDGEIYAVDLLGDNVYWLDYEFTDPRPRTWVTSLSETGCFDSLDGPVPAAGVLPYTLNMPFWSDGAVKDRGLALPEGGLITYNAEGAWGFPNGTVLIKTFRLAEDPLETRLLVRESGEWLGATYRWDDDGLDATVVLAPTEVDLGDQTWLFPGPGQCDQCHTPAAGFVLGWHTPQLNIESDLFDLGADVNQIEALAEVGYFTSPDAIDASGLPRFPRLDDTEAPLEERARAYLEVNCSNCHRAGGPTQSSLELEATTPLSGMNACDTAPTLGDLGVEDPRLIAPGSSERSIIWHRIDRTTEAERMPPLGRFTTDSLGRDVVGAWIDGLTGCD